MNFINRLLCFAIALLAFALMSRAVSATSYCYQAQANVSTACGGLDSGAYNISIPSGSYYCNLTSSSNISDGNWSTYTIAKCSGWGAYVDYNVNFSKPTNYSLDNVSVRYGEDGRNATLPTDCLNYYSEKIILQYKSTLTFSYPTLSVFCRGSSGWHVLAIVNGWNDIRDASVWWGLQSPTVKQWIPANNNFSIAVEQNLTCNVSDPDNTSYVEFYVWDTTGYPTFLANNVTNSNRTLGGLSNSSSLLINLTNQTYLWNCKAYNVNGDSNWGTTNFSLTIDSVAPVSNPIKPIDNSLVNSSEVNFVCDETDNYNLKNVTMTLWNVTDIVVTNSSNITGITNETNYNFVLPAAGTYHWNCLVYDLAGNSAWHSENLTLAFATITNCSSGASTLNLSNYNENLTSTPLLMDAEFEIKYWINNNPANYSMFNIALYNSTTYSICLSPSDMVFGSDIYVKYTTPGGFTHSYYAFNKTLSNASSNVSVYNFDTMTGISTFNLAVRNRNNYQLQPSILVYLQRYYVGEGVWRTVQMGLTDSFGEVNFDILERTTDYRFVLFNTNNEQLLVSDRNKWVCTSSYCTGTIFTDATLASPNVYLQVATSFNNNTNVITTTWTNPESTNTNVEIKVRSLNSTGTKTVCNQSYYGSSGSFTCDISGKTSGDVTVDTFVNGVLQHSDYVSVAKQGLALLLNSKDSTFWGFGIILTCFSAGMLISPAAAVATMIFGIIASFLLHLIPAMTIPYVMIIALIGLFVMYKVKV